MDADARRVPRGRRRRSTLPPRRPSRSSPTSPAGRDAGELRTPTTGCATSASRSGSPTRSGAGRAGRQHLPGARARTPCSPRWPAAWPSDAGRGRSSPLLRADRAEAPTLAPAARPGLHARGVPVDWARRASPAPAPAGRRCPPTPSSAALLARRRRRPRRRGRPRPDAAGHPLLGAAVGLADGDGAAAHRPARRSRTHPGWPTTPSRRGRCCPAPPSSSWRCAPATRSAAPLVEELTLAGTAGAARAAAASQVQVVVGGADARPAAPSPIHSRPEPTPTAAWTRHATGAARPGAGRRPAPTSRLAARPAPQPVDLTSCYARAGRPGYGYGPAFQGLAAVWRHGDEVFAEVALPEAGPTPPRFGLHPALLDAALHAIDARPGDRRRRRPAAVRLDRRRPARRRRRRAAGPPRPDRPRQRAVALADATGAPVASVESLVSRPVSDRPARRPPGTARHGRPAAWTTLASGPPRRAPRWAVPRRRRGSARPTRSRTPPRRVRRSGRRRPRPGGRSSTASPPSVRHRALRGALDDRSSSGWPTRGSAAPGAVVAAEVDRPRRPTRRSGAWCGLAQAENPGPLRLLDSTARDAPGAALPAALAAGEPQLAAARRRLLGAPGRPRTGPRRPPCRRGGTARPRSAPTARC